METMTPQHTQWAEFYNKLSEAVQVHGCRHETKYTRAILTVMGLGPDAIEKSLAGLARKGGHCDCEIFMNCGTGRERPERRCACVTGLWPPRACILCKSPLGDRMAVEGRAPDNNCIEWYICEHCGELYADALRRVTSLRQKKQELLDKYAGKQPTEFTQWDAFVDVAGDSVMHADADGDAVMWGETTELMSGCSEVRVLIRKGVPISPDKAVVLLQKIGNCIKQSGLTMPKVPVGDGVPF